jgi:hypothetical protein
VNRVAAWCLSLYGVGLLVVGGLILLVIGIDVPTPSELLRDIAEHRATWITANVVLVVQQAALTVGAPAVARLIAPTSRVAADAVLGLLVIAAGALIASGTAHAVLGAHLASEVTAAPLDPDLVRAGKVLHALGDASWFIGLAALTAATGVCSAVWWRAADPATRFRARLGAAAVVAGLLQYGWFVAHVLGFFAAPAALLQAGWFVAIGAATTGQPPGPVVEASTS